MPAEMATLPLCMQSGHLRASPTTCAAAQVKHPHGLQPLVDRLQAQPRDGKAHAVRLLYCSVFVLWSPMGSEFH